MVKCEWCLSFKGSQQTQNGNEFICDRGFQHPVLTKGSIRRGAMDNGYYILNALNERAGIVDQKVIGLFGDIKPCGPKAIHFRDRRKNS